MSQFLQQQTDSIKAKRLKKRTEKVLKDFNSELETLLNEAKGEISEEKKMRDKKRIEELTREIQQLQ